MAPSYFGRELPSVGRLRPSRLASLVPLSVDPGAKADTKAPRPTKGMKPCAYLCLLGQWHGQSRNKHWHEKCFLSRFDVTSFCGRIACKGYEAWRVVRREQRLGARGPSNSWGAEFSHPPRVSRMLVILEARQDSVPTLHSLHEGIFQSLSCLSGCSGGAVLRVFLDPEAGAARRHATVARGLPETNFVLRG